MQARHYRFFANFITRAIVPGRDFVHLLAIPPSSRSVATFRPSRPPLPNRPLAAFNSISRTTVPANWIERGPEIFA